MTIKNNRPEQATLFSANMTNTPQAGSLRLSHLQARQALRREAEEIAMENAALSPESLNALSPEETRQTLHELRVHQIELEMQNEELRRAQVEISAARARYFDLYDMAPVGYCTICEKGRILEANLTATTLLGVARAKLVDQHISRFIFNENQNIYYLHCKQLFDTGKPQAFDLRMVKNNGAAFWAHIESIIAQDAKGVSVNRVVISDISERKLAETVLQRTHDELERQTEALLESEKHYRELVEGTPGIIYSFSIKRGGVYYSSHVTDILGYSPEQLYAQPMLWYNSIHPDERYSVDQLIRDSTTCKPFCIEYRIRDALGNWHWFEDRSTGYHFDGIDTIVEGLVLDITERKGVEEALQEANKALRASLEEKDVLLKEVHHRVKNNLAAIMGLLDLQGQKIVDKAARASLVELSNRIRSMSLVHEQLYQSENFARIDLQCYLDSLTAHLHSSYQSSRNIHVSVAAAGVNMALDSAIPCGLLITELVTNAFKYAFPEGQSCSGAVGCEIAVSAAWDGAAYTLTVTDNGIGLPAGLDWTKTKTLGLVLVKMLGQHQLRGKIEVDCTGGTTFRLRFAPRIACVYE
jgi:PAS domain S-box-containing protein